MGLIDSYPAIYLPRDVHGAFEVIDHAHHEIHAGKYFNAHVYDADLDTASTLSLMITAPATGEIHLTGLVTATVGGEFSWSEAPNVTGGTSITSYNQNRQSSNAATATVVSDPTVTSVGTVFEQVHVGESGNPSQSAGGNFSARQEWILAQDTKYLLQFTAGGDNTEITIIFEWYEES